MTSIIIGYKLNSGMLCLDRPINNVPYSMIRIDGKLRDLNNFVKAVKTDMTFDNTLLKKYELYYREI